MTRPHLVIGNYNYSSWSLRAWLALRHAGIEFDVTRIALDVPGYREALRAHSPAGRVPVLIIDDQHVWDSMAIALIAAERQPALWPSMPGERWHAYAISAEMHSGFAALRSAMPMNCRATGRHVPVDAALGEDLARVEAIFTDCPRTAPGWLFGRFTVADAMFAPVVSRLRTYGVPLGEPAGAYVDHVLSDPIMAEWVAQASVEPEVIDGEEVGIT